MTQTSSSESFSPRSSITFLSSRAEINLQLQIKINKKENQKKYTIANKFSKYDVPICVAVKYSKHLPNFLVSLQPVISRVIREPVKNVLADFFR